MPQDLDLNTIFNLTDTVDTAKTVIVPVPWDLTTTYHHGTAGAPVSIQTASAQLDLTHPWKGQVWQDGIAMSEFPDQLYKLNQRLRPLATQLVSRMDNLDTDGLATINLACQEMVDHVYQETAGYLSQNKYIVLLGGEHGVGLGFYRALKERFGSFGILQVDAHMDLRNAYLGMTYSHASCMYNALETYPIDCLVQVGIRDYALEELRYAQSHDKKIVTYPDFSPHNHNKGVGVSRYNFAEIVTHLPSNVFLSIDIDGLDPSLCPHAGTPVPGGLSYHHLQDLLYALDQSGKHVIGSELVEVGVGAQGDDWDANVGARILYLLCGFAT